MQTLGQPTWIGQYRLTSRVATGGMAEVYVGRHIDAEGKFGPMVAVKKLLPHLVKDSSVVRMFLNEARITAQISHPNVVKIFELGQVDGEPFIAMELLEGRTWADLRQRAAEDGRRMPMGVALFVLTEACRGLDAAHRAKGEDGQPLSLVHRDFTPDNIHVGVRGEVKVIDFGIAKTASWGAGTEPGTLKGKFFYMSPEMILAKPVDHRADIFAAGVMLYEQLCGRRPFTGTSVDEVVMKIAAGKPVPPSHYDPAVPRALEAVCLTALNRNPEARFQTLGDFVDAIEAVGGEAQLSTPQEVGEYLASLFPEKSDERRLTLRKAREADPSVPSARVEASTAALADTHPTPGRADAAREASRPTEAVPQFVPADQPEPITASGPSPLAAPVPISSEPVELKGLPGEAEPKRSPLPIVLGVLALLAVAAGAFFVLKPPGGSPSELLTQAEQTQTPGDKAKLVVAMSKSKDVEEEQLAKGAALLLEASQWEAALEVVDAWLLKNPKSLEARLAEARAATNARKGKRADNAIKEASALAPNDARPDVAFAELRELQGDSGGALEGWTRAASKAPNDVRNLARQGYWLSQSSRLDEAGEVLAKVLKKHPGDAASAAELGFVKLRKNQLGDAIRLLQGAVKAKPELLEAHYYLGAALYAKGDVKGARVEYLEADKLAGADQRALTALCEMEKMENAPELEDTKKKLKERFPQDAAALVSKCDAAQKPE